MAHVKGATLTFTSSFLAPRSGTLPPLFEDDFSFEIPLAGGPEVKSLFFFFLFSDSTIDWCLENTTKVFMTLIGGLTCRKHPLPLSTSVSSIIDPECQCAR